MVTAEPPVTVKTIDCVHQIGPVKKHRFLQCVTLMLDVYQVTVSVAVSKIGVVLIKQGVKVNGQYCSKISYSLNKC